MYPFDNAVLHHSLKQVFVSLLVLHIKQAPQFYNSGQQAALMPIKHLTLPCALLASWFLASCLISCTAIL